VTPAGPGIDGYRVLTAGSAALSDVAAPGRRHTVVAMGAVRREALRRWSLVGAGVALLCLLPTALALLPSRIVDADPAGLRALILASAVRPYQGYAASRGEILLPELPALGEVTTLLGPATRIRLWHASPQSWRVAVLDQTGERDTYRTADGTFMWDFERNLVTYVAGVQPLRLPGASDLLPPDLARRLLGGAGAADSLIPLPSRRVAGVDAAGLRLTPTDPETTIGRVDVWADPATGLPVQVEVASRDSAATIFVSRFLDLDQRTPDPGLLTPVLADSAGFTVTTAQDVATVINGVVPVDLPANLAGRPRTANPVAGADLGGVAAYGTGLSMFVVVALPGRVGSQALQAARDKGGTAVTFVGGLGYETRASLIGGLVVRSDGDRRTRRTFVLAGPVSADVLRRAGAELLAAGAGAR